MFWKIAKIGNSEPIALAASELKKYLSQIDKYQDIAILCYNQYNPSYKDMLWVGVCDDFKLPEVENNLLDDAISINVTGNVGYITGSNERAVLIAVYRYLRELGCAFLRPGDDGEIIPKKDISDSCVNVFEAPSYRHRSVCIEGSVNYNDIHDMIEWLPKVGMNGFYNQFRIPHTFYNRWYAHLNNEDILPPYDFTPDDSEGLMNESVADIKRRGLLYHAIGHGWTSEPFGIKALGWGSIDNEIDNKTKSYFAEIDGKRDLWRGVPMNTNLCYSSDDVQEIMSDAIAEYSSDHPEIDYLHVWLADGTNNHCECENCKKHRPSDLYVRLLNKIDKKLTNKALDTKIVFLIYVDLLWEPIEEKLDNPERFVLMFAPITRTYSSSMADSSEFKGELPDYNRNKNKMPSSVEQNIAHLKNWQKNFKGDSFDFDYHYMWDHHKDIGNYDLAKVLFDDMKNLDKIGLNGMVSCQCIRAFFPHGLGMNAMATALWNKNADFEETADNYFNNAFGKDGILVKNYMKDLSYYGDPVFMRNEYENTVDPSRVPRFEKGIELIDSFKSVIDRNLNHPNKTVALSYYYLSYHSEFAKLYLNMMIELSNGNIDSVNAAKENLRQYTKTHEKELWRVFDTYIFNSKLDRNVEKLINNIKEKDII